MFIFIRVKLEKSANWRGVRENQGFMKNQGNVLLTDNSISYLLCLDLLLVFLVIVGKHLVKCDVAITLLFLKQ